LSLADNGFLSCVFRQGPRAQDEIDHIFMNSLLLQVHNLIDRESEACFGIDYRVDDRLRAQAGFCHLDDFVECQILTLGLGRQS
jgi:hypothetical protein